MAITTNYGVTLLEQSQAQKEVTINEALGIIDAVLKGSVIDKDLATPPGIPAQSDAYIVASSATGAWSGKSKSIAYYDQIWRFITPVSGMRVWVSDEQCYYQYSGTAWVTSNPSITGNAASATKLQTARNINGVAFDGTADITISGGSSGNLTGEVTSVGLATTVTNSSVIGKVLTGYTSGAGTVASTDSILQAVQKLNGNVALKAPLASPTFTGTVSGITASMVGAPGGSGTSSGTNTGDQTTITGNAGTATKLQTARNINGVLFDGSADITISGGGGGNLTGEVTSVGLATTVTNSAVIGKVLTGYTSSTGSVTSTDSLLQAIQKLNGNDGLKAPLASPTFTGTVSGITAAMVGAPSGSGTSSGTNTGDQTSISGNAGTATKLQTSRLINGVAFDGTADISIGGGSTAASSLTGTILAAGVVASSLTSVGTIATGVWNGTAINAVYGGTGQTSYSIGDVLYASTSSALSKLAGVATGNALLSGGISTAPAWGKIGLTTHVSGTLPVANGGTGVTISTGSGNAVLSTSPTLVTPILGTPASGTLTNCVGLPVSSGISGLATGVATFLTTPSSANLASAITDETGTGALVFAASPTLSGTPLAPTASAGTNTTQIATTAFALANNFTLAPPVASTSGTVIGFTGIPSTAKKIVMCFNGVSTNGTNALLLQFGISSGYDTTGYNSASTYYQGIAPFSSPIRYSSGIGIQYANTTTTLYGVMECTLMDASNNIWVVHGNFSTSSGDYLYMSAGGKSLSGTLDRVRLTTVGGTDAFDAGSLNILWG